MLQTIYHFGKTRALLLKDSHGCNIFHYAFGLCTLHGNHKKKFDLDLTLLLLALIWQWLVATVFIVFGSFLLFLAVFAWKAKTQRSFPVFSPSEVAEINEKVKKFFDKSLLKMFLDNLRWFYYQLRIYSWSKNAD